LELEIIEKGNIKIAKTATSETVINTIQDALDLMANADYQGARKIIVHENNLNPKFFSLKTGFAGEVLQKYSNYHMKLAIIGEFTKYTSNALHAFIVECNRGNNIFFVPDVNSALEKLV
jgi:hypothetical protein